MFRRILFLSCSLAAMRLLAQEHAAQKEPGSAAEFQISGVLVNSLTGQPVRSARVVMSPVTNREAYSLVITGEDGRFIFRDLKEGKYGLRAQRHGYLTRSFDQHEQWSTAIAVGPGLDSNNLVFRLPPECAISGRTSDEAGEPVTNGQVSLYQTGSPGLHGGIFLRQQTQISAEGLYHFGHLPPGKYFLVVTSTPWYAQRPQSQPRSQGPVMGRATGTYSPDEGRSPLDVAYPTTFYPGVTEAGAATPIILKEGERFEADMNLQPVPALTLHVPSSARGSADNTRTNFLQLETMAFNRPIASTGQTQELESGDLEITGVAPGSYQLQILDRHDQHLEISKTAQIDAANSGEISLEHEIPSSSITANVQLDPGVTAPLNGVLRLFNANTGDMVQQQVSSAGELQMEGTLRPGSYEVSFLNTRGEFIKTLSAEGGSVAGRVLEIKGPVKVNLTIARGQGSVTGVALRDGKPTGGVMIILVPADAAHNQAIFRRDQSDSDGTFNLPSVVPGRYTLLAIENRWDLEWLNPDALKPYFSKGEVLEVQQDGKYSVKANVQ